MYSVYCQQSTEGIISDVEQIAKNNTIDDCIKIIKENFSQWKQCNCFNDDEITQKSNLKEKNIIIRYDVKDSIDEDYCEYQIVSE